MDGTVGVGSDRKCEMDESLSTSIERPSVADRGAKLLEGGPDIRMVLSNELCSGGQRDGWILGEISRR